MFADINEIVFTSISYIFSVWQDFMQKTGYLPFYILVVISSLLLYRVFFSEN